AGPWAAGAPDADGPQPPKKGEPVPAAGDDPLQKRFPRAIGDNGPVVMGDLFRFIEDATDMVVRVDVAAFRRVRAWEWNGATAGEFLNSIYETKAILPRRTDRLTIHEGLTDALAQVPAVPCTFQVRGNQIVIVPAFQP